MWPFLNEGFAFHSHVTGYFAAGVSCLHYHKANGDLNGFCFINFQGTLY